LNVFDPMSAWGLNDGLVCIWQAMCTLWCRGSSVHCTRRWASTFWKV